MLPEPVEGLNSREGVDAEEFNFQDSFMGQAGENMGKHGLIKKTGIEPQDDTVIRCWFRKSLVLMMQCFAPLKLHNGQDRIVFLRNHPQLLFSAMH